MNDYPQHTISDDTPNPVPSGTASPGEAPLYAYAAPPTVEQLYRQQLTQKMLSVKGLQTTLFSFLFCYLVSEAAFTSSLPGLGITLCVVVFCLYTFYTLYLRNARRNPAALPLYIPILIIGLGYGLHYNPASHLAMTLTLLCLLALQLVLLCNKNLKEAFSTGMIRHTLGRVLLKPLWFLASPFKTFMAGKSALPKRLKNVLLALLGVAVALPVCLLLLNWFSGADPAFAAGLRRFTAWLQRILSPQWGRIALNLFFMLLFGVFLAAVLLFNTTDNNKADEARKTKTPAVGAVPVTAFLSAVGVVMVAFVVTQFTYFFFGAANGVVAEIGYAEYARNGFFELCYASTLVFAVVILAMAVCKKRDGGRLPAAVTGLLSVVCLSNIVILVSAVMRMLLYVEAHGLSVKRLMTLWFMPVLGICTVVLIVRLYAVKMPALKAAGVTVVAAVCLLSVVNTDRVVARQQVDRFINSGFTIELDVGYFYSLSYGCLPEIDRLLETQGDALTPDQRQELATCRDIIIQHALEASDERNGVLSYTLDRIGR